jgi:hypothetical protein
MLPAVKTYDVQLVQPDGKSGAGKYESPTGELPDVGDLIEVDQQGTRALVSATCGQTTTRRSAPNSSTRSLTPRRPSAASTAPGSTAKPNAQRGFSRLVDAAHVIG